MNQRSRSASVVSIGERCASVSVGFHFSKARESLEKAKNSGDFHKLQAALDAATLLPKANAGSDDSAALTIQPHLSKTRNSPKKLPKLFIPQSSKGARHLPNALTPVDSSPKVSRLRSLHTWETGRIGKRFYH